MRGLISDIVSKIISCFFGEEFEQRYDNQIVADEESIRKWRKGNNNNENHKKFVENLKTTQPSHKVIYL